MREFSFKFMHVIRLDASPAVERIVERVTNPGPEMGALMGELMATARELLDALKAGVEQTEANKAEVDRLRAEKAEHAEQDRIRDEEEAAEDAAEVVEDEEHAQAVAAFQESQRVDRARIAELQAVINDGLILTPDEQAEFRQLTDRLRATGPVPPV